MKILSMVMLGMTLISGRVAIAVENTVVKDNFDAARATSLKGISMHIEILKKYKVCIEAATAMPAMSECNREKAMAMKALKEEMRNAKFRQIQKKNGVAKSGDMAKPEQLPAKPAE
ncbi:MAG: hypothetical protein OEZ15_07355 [Gammaproteobacteria bacterium]|nr:hypothetical protein [Gammaproteobacteria bacterium]